MGWTLELESFRRDYIQASAGTQLKITEKKQYTGRNKQSKPLTVGDITLKLTSAGGCAHHVRHIVQLVSGLGQRCLIELRLRVGAHLATKPEKQVIWEVITSICNLHPLCQEQWRGADK